VVSRKGFCLPTLPCSQKQQGSVNAVSVACSQKLQKPIFEHSNASVFLNIWKRSEYRGAPDSAA